MKIIKLKRITNEGFFKSKNSCLRLDSVRSYSAHIINSTWQHDSANNMTILFYFINIVSDKPASS